MSQVTNLGSFISIGSLNSAFPPTSVSAGTTAYVSGVNSVFTCNGTSWQSASTSLAVREAGKGGAKPIPASTKPTITYSGTQSGTKRVNAVTSPGTTNTPNTLLFSFSAAIANFGIRNTAVPQNQILQTNYSTAAADFSVQFFHTGSVLDILKYGSGSGFSLWVDDVYVGKFQPLTNTGTAQGGGSNTITLASGANASNNWYIYYTVAIISGTGAGQVNQITGYVGSTKVATMANNWTTNPDSTSVYVVCDDANGYYCNPLDGSVNYVTLNWGSIATRKITYVGVDFGGVYTGSHDTIAPAPFDGLMRFMYVGDSFVGGTGGPYRINPQMSHMLPRSLGMQGWIDGSGGTGWCATNTGISLTFMDRIAPPTESFILTQTGGTGGTFTVSITYGGSTQTTSAIAYNATAATVQTAIQALSNVVANAVAVGSVVGYPPGWVVCLHSMSGATMTANLSGITGLTASSLTNYLGTVAPNVPYDGNGFPLPFVLFVQGSGNDPGSAFTASQVQINATYTAQQIVARFPTAIAIFSGVTSISSTTLTSGNIAYNTALATAAASLTPINGSVPFLDTYATGVGGNGWITGSGTAASPTSNTNDILSSVTFSGHPTGDGHLLIASRNLQGLRAVLGAK
jgi:hypothetical protein